MFKKKNKQAGVTETYTQVSFDYARWFQTIDIVKEKYKYNQ